MHSAQPLVILSPKLQWVFFFIGNILQRTYINKIGNRKYLYTQTYANRQRHMDTKHSQPNIKESYSMSLLFQEFVYFIFVLSLTWLLPLTVMLGSYLTIIVVLYRRSRIFNGPKGNLLRINSDALIGKAKIKTIKITGVLVIGFILCWTPYNAMFLW